MAINTPQTNQTVANLAGQGNIGSKPAVAGNIDISQRAKAYIPLGPGDSPLGAFTSEGTAEAALPKSLFYEYTEGPNGAPSGLFNYYVLGQAAKSGPGNTGAGPNPTFSYNGSEANGFNKFVTPEVSRNPSAALIIQQTTKDGSYLDPTSPYIGQPYNVKDFIFCKDYGIIPNNRMITLRRFPTPVFDNLKVPASAVYPDASNPQKIQPAAFEGFLQRDLANNQINVPICQAVSYFGEGTGNSLNDIIGVESGFKWRNLPQDTKASYTNNDPGLYDGFSSVLSALFSPGVNKTLESINKVGGAILEPQNIEAIYTRYLYNNLTKSGAPLSERLFVDINTVSDSWVRNVGLTGKNSTFTLTFKYNLNSVSDINSKMLFLDLFANLMSLGVDYGKFLVPQILENPQTRGFSFPGGSEAYKQFIGDPIAWLIGIMQQKHDPAAVAKTKQLTDNAKKFLGELEKLADGKSVDLSKIDQNGSFYKSFTMLLTSKMLDKLVFEPLIISGYPTGDWHIVVGNPLNPIAMIGNLICEGVKITFDEELGPDDFPTGMTAVYTLRHARMRHRGDYESMFNRGNGRLYLGEFFTTSADTNQVTPSGQNPNKIDLSSPSAIKNSALQLAGSTANKNNQ